jgi:hypothetical protein
MAGEEVEIVLMTPHRSRGRGPGRGLGGRKGWAKAWIIGKADEMLNDCLYERHDVDSTLLGRYFIPRLMDTWFLFSHTAGVRFDLITTTWLSHA